MINIEQLSEFCTVVRFKNITKAAEYLFISQPSLSRHISELEVTLGTKLIDRSNSKVFALTKSGILLYQEGEKLLSELEEIESHVKRLSNSTLGTLRISTRSHENEAWTNIIYDFRQEYPDIDLRLFDMPEEPLINSILGDHADFAFAYDYEIWQHKDRIEALYMGTEDFCALVSKKSPLSSLEAISIAELQEQTHIIVRDPEEGIYDKGTLNDVLSLFPKTAPALNFSSMILQTQIGDGFCILPRSLAATHATCKSLEICDLNKPFHSFLIWSKENSNPSIPLFVDFIKGYTLQ